MGKALNDLADGTIRYREIPHKWSIIRVHGIEVIMFIVLLMSSV